MKKSKKLQNKIIVILGQTSSGKTDLAVDLAKKFNGKVVSADSRQVFRGLNIGSGKVTKKEMKGIPHYLLDVASPNKAFSVTQFKKKADKVIKDILKRGKVPIIAGGTGFYIQAIVDNLILPQVKPNLKLRKELEALIPKKIKSQTSDVWGDDVWEKNREAGLKELVKRLKKLDSQRLKNIDQKNPRRLMRAIEIATALGKVPKLKITRGCRTPHGTKWSGVSDTLTSNFQFLKIGIKTDPEVLKERIAKRFRKRVRAGIVAEAKKLHKKGMTWKRMNEIGLSHKHIAKYLKEKNSSIDKPISKKEMIENSIREEQQYAKRQKTWFKRDKRIEWFKFEDKKNIEERVRLFLQK